jgi:hypothetical protein
MAVVMVMHWPEATLEHYEEARRRVRWEEDAPIGGLNHVAWFEDDGLHVVDLWESASDFERFAEERLMPVVKGEIGIPGEPIVRYAALHAHFVPEAARV